MKVKAGSTNVSVYYYIVQDASATSPGEPVTGLLFSDIETGGSASYVRQGAARTDLTLITLASASAGHADGGFILVDDTNMPGLYRCDYPDAAFATGIDQVFLQIVVASGKNAIAAPILVDIDDNVDQTADHTASLADIPTVAEFNARTLVAASYFDPTTDAVANVTLVATTTALTNVINAASIVASVSGNVDGSVDSVTGDTKQTADHTAAIADIPTVAEFNARTLLAASYFDPAADAVANVTLVATTTVLTNVINAASIVASVSGNVDGSVDSVTGDTKQTADHTAGIADIPTVAEFNARTILAASYFDPAADAVANVTLCATTTTNTDMVAAPTTLLTTQMTEAYAANGVAPTMAQSLFAIHQMLMEFAIAGTSYTVKKLDSSTTAFVVTLDDAINPTSNTR